MSRGIDFAVSQQFGSRGRLDSSGKKKGFWEKFRVYSGSLRVGRGGCGAKACRAPRNNTMLALGVACRSHARALVAGLPRPDHV